MLKSRTEQFAVVVQQQADDATTRQQRLRQQQVVLTYNALRTMLGRTPGIGSTGAAVVFMADRVERSGNPRPDGDSIMIGPNAPFRAVEDGWKLVVITTTGQTLPTAPIYLDKPVHVDNLGANVDVARLEIRDQDDTPLYLGVGPATQTDNAREDKRRQIAEGGTTAEDPDEPPRVSYDDGISAPAR
jgi:hypothetical protein